MKFDKREFNIMDFGAKPDMSGDSTAAVQSALDEAAKCRGTVLVPSGDYLVGKLKIGAGVAMRGTSAWGFRRYGTSVFHLSDPGHDCMLDMTGAFGASVSGVCLDGRRMPGQTHGVKVDWEVYNGGGEEDTVTLDDCRIGDFSGDGVHLRHIWCFSVRHCMICHNGGCGLYIDGWDAFILDNWFSGNRNCGILGGPCTSSITVTGNRIEWNSRAGIRLFGGNCYNITGNYFDRSGGPGLSLGGGGKIDTVTVTGNIFYRSGKPCEALTDDKDNCHIRLNGCENITVTGNAFRPGRDDNGKGVFSPEHSAVLENNRFVIFKDNAIHGGCLGDEIINENNESIIVTDNLI